MNDIYNINPDTSIEVIHLNDGNNKVNEIAFQKSNGLVRVIQFSDGVILVQLIEQESMTTMWSNKSFEDITDPNDKNKIKILVKK